MACTLDVPKSWVELEVWLEVLWEEELDLHRVLGPVVQDDSLSIELLVDKDIQIVFLFLNVDGYIDALSTDGDWDWLRVVLVFEEQGEVLLDLGQFIWDEDQLYLAL